MKKAGPVMSKGALAQAIADALEMKKKDVATVLDSLASIAATEVKKAGKFTIPGVAMVKTRVKPATKAGKREIFGKVVVVKAKPAKLVVKAYTAGATARVRFRARRGGSHGTRPRCPFTASHCPV